MGHLYVGLMSGTSLDGIDVALVEFDDGSGARVIHAKTLPFPAALAAEMRAIIIDHDPCNLRQLGSLDYRFGDLYADAVIALVSDANVAPEAITAIGCHGQTICHAPDDPHPFTLQIGDANRIAAHTGITTVADFRRRDMALGGQGAPLAPAFHAAVFASGDEDRVVLNLGGIANITLLKRQQNVSGFDTGPANGLLDAWNRQHNARPYDNAGAWAAGGTADQELLEYLRADEYFERPPPKSTGREYFSTAWLTGHLLNLQTPPAPQDVQATLAELTVSTIADDIKRYAGDVHTCVVCGGGTHNTDLLRRLRTHLAPTRVISSADLGISPDFVEAAAFAWLAKQTIEHKPGNLPAVTGARKPTILGAIYPA